MNKIFLIILYVNIFGVGLLAQSAWQKINKNFGIDYPSLTVTVNTNPSSGYLFLGPTTLESGHLIILDNDLVPIFYKKIAGGTVFDFKLQQNGKLTYNISSVHSYGMDSSGIVDKEFIAPDGYVLDVHELQVMEDQSYYIIGISYITIDMSQYVSGGDTAAILLANTIHHMDANDNEIWRWNSFDHYDILDVDEFVNLTNHVIDWTHCNSIDIDTEGNVIVSTRNFNEITKINRQTGEIIWRLGGEKNQFQFINDNRGFSRQHDARVLSNGNIALFDNGQYLIPEYSSYVEYEIDPQNHKATLLRRYSRDGSIYSAKKGGLQELPNGNILISWDGVLNPLISEINQKDSTVYEVRYDNSVQQYRTYRFPWKSNLFSIQYDSLEFGEVAVGDSSSLDVKIYNRRDNSVTINEVLSKDSSFYINDNLPLYIPPQDSIEITLIFEPFEKGKISNKIYFGSVTDTLLIAQQIIVHGEAISVTEVEELTETISYSLSQNYPNPFNPITIINYQLPLNSFVTLKVYDVLGNEIATLVNEEKPAGVYEVEFNVNQLSRVEISTGIYFYQIKAGDFMLTKKMILLR